MQNRCETWDTETMNLIFEQDCLTRQGAECALADFVMLTLRKQDPSASACERNSGDY